MVAQTLRDPVASSPDEVERRRRMALALMQSQQPVGHWTQGLSNLTGALMGGLAMRRANRDEKAGRAEANRLLSQILMGGASEPAMAPVAGMPPAGMPAAATAEGGMTPNQRVDQAFADTETAPGAIGRMLTETATKYGIDPVAFSRVAQIESNYNPEARNPSGASGLFQFMPATASQYDLQNPMDPAANADAAARLWNDNRRQLIKALGREPTAGEMYLAHQQGAGGAAKLLSNPDAPAADLLGLQPVVQNAGRPDMTAAQFAQQWTGRMGDMGGGAPLPQGTVPPQGAMPAARAPDDRRALLAAVLGNEWIDPAIKGYALQQMQPPSPVKVGADEVLLDPRTWQPIYQGGGKPTDDIREYEYYVRQERDSGRAPLGFNEWALQSKRAAATNVNVGTEKGYDKTVGEGYGKRFLDLQDTAQSAQSALSSLDMMEQALADPGFYSGAGAQTVLQLKRFGAALGMNPEGIESIESFNAMAKQAALDNMGGSLGTGFSNADRDFVTDQVPGLQNTPQGNQTLIEITRRINRRKIEMAQLARDYAGQHGGRIDAGFDDYARQYAEANPLFRPDDPIFAPPAAPAAEPGGEIPQIQSIEDYDRLPEGAQYRDPNGNVRVKGRS